MKNSWRLLSLDIAHSAEEAGHSVVPWKLIRLIISWHCSFCRGGGPFSNAVKIYKMSIQTKLGVITHSALRTTVRFVTSVYDMLSIFRSVQEEFATIRADVSRIHPDQATLSECQQLGSRSGKIFCLSWSESKLFAVVISWHILCILRNFCAIFVIWLFKIKFFKKLFQEHYQSVKQFGCRSGPTFCQSWSGSKLFAKVISRW